MTERKGSITNEDFMEVLKGQKEVGNKYKTHFFSMFSHLFSTIAEEVITQFGDEGRKAIGEAVKKFGEERGRKIAKLVKSLGKELTLTNFYIYGDLDGGQITKSKLKIVDGNVEVLIRDCMFCNTSRDWDKLEYGKIYCEYVDQAIIKGYNPDIILEIPMTMTGGDNKCHFKYFVKEKE